MMEWYDDVALPDFHDDEGEEIIARFVDISAAASEADRVNGFGVRASFSGVDGLAGVTEVLDDRIHEGVRLHVPQKFGPFDRPL